MSSYADKLFEKLGYKKVNDNRYKKRASTIVPYDEYIDLDEYDQSFIKYIKNTTKQISLAEWISKKELDAVAAKLEELRNK